MVLCRATGFGRLRSAQRREDTLGRLARAGVGRSEEVEGVGGKEELPQAVAGLAGLTPSFGGEFDSVVRGVLVDVPVF